MGSANPDTARRLAAFAGLALLAAGCADTGFGQPCTLPKVDEIRRACEEGDAPPVSDPDQPQFSTKPSCAVRNFAGCETLVCLVYRGSDPFCSESCTCEAGKCKGPGADTTCEENAPCLPLIGDIDQDPDLCASDEGDCYCVRKADADN